MRIYELARLRCRRQIVGAQDARQAVGINGTAGCQKALLDFSFLHFATIWSENSLLPAIVYLTKLK